MLFSSPEFLFAFLSCTIVLYYLFRGHTAIKNAILLIGSLFFYAWGEPRFVLIMIASIACNYIVGRFVGAYMQKDKGKAANAALTLGVILNLGLLFVFKYLTFTLKNLDAWLGLDFAIPEIALPIGISFFTFQSMSYLFDVRRGDAEVQKNPLDLALYVALFPQLIAGPIVRYQTVADQIKCRKETWSAFSMGICRFLVGLFKKVLISNNMGLVADRAFEMNAQGTMNTPMAWLGAVSYALQIYYDFSGYSDMAIGLGHMFGFSFEENFNYPYISTSVTEFWRRWHISLGTWFRDYVYFPLGGSRVKSKARLIFNLAVVWILTGVWHGAAWNFLLWGVWFFVLLTIEKLFFAKHLRADTPFYKRIPGFLYAMLTVLLGWVLFRAETLGAVASYLSVMFGMSGGDANDTTALLFLGQKAVYYIAAVLFCAPIVPYTKKKLELWRERGGIVSVIPIVFDILTPIVLLGLLLVTVAFLIKSDYNPFIYFNF